MSRIRSVHPGLFTDEAFMTATPFARLLMIGIWTEAWDDGVFEWKPLTIKARLFPVDTVNVADLLAELEWLGVVQRFDAGKPYGAIRNFQKYQRPKKPNSSGVLPDEMGNYVGSSYRSSEPVPHQLPTSGEKSPQMEDGGWREGVKKEDTSSLRSDVSAPPIVKPPPKSRGTRINPDIELSTEHVTIARTIGLPDDRIRPEFDKFRDHFLSKSGPNGVKVDWAATWRNWCRNAADGFGKSGGARSGGNRQPDDGYLGAARRAAARFQQAADVPGERPDVFDPHRSIVVVR